jgi:hypothetical protein
VSSTSEVPAEQPAPADRPSHSPARRLRISQAALAATLRELRTSRAAPARGSVGERQQIEDAGELEHALDSVRAAQEREAL